MKGLGLAGFLILLAIIPLAQICISSFYEYAEVQREADQEEIDCANSVCFGQGLTASEAKERFDTSMQFLLMTLLIGPVGAFLIGRNWKELIEEEY